MDARTKIRLLNDNLRRTLGLTGAGRTVMTAGVSALPGKDIATILTAVRTFNAFSEGDDPHREHDFGAFTAADRRCFFKIDYFDKAMKFASADPSDPAQTTRVLTIMLASEY
jgi:hypothetical protein